MKRNLLVIFFLLMGYWTLGLAQDSYTLDPEHTAVQFSISHFGFSYPTGKWMIYKGNLILDPQHPQNSKVTVVIKINTLVTGVPELDKHLMTRLFFNTLKYPLASFSSNKVEIIDATHATVSGDLTLHGVKKPLVLQVTLNRQGMSLITKKPTLGFSIEGSLKRSDFGMTNLVPDIGDDVNLTIQAEAYKVDTK